METFLLPHHQTALDKLSCYLWNYNLPVAMPFFDVTAYTTDAERNLELTHESAGITTVDIPAKSITTIVFDK